MMTLIYIIIALGFVGAVLFIAATMLSSMLSEIEDLGHDDGERM